MPERTAPQTPGFNPQLKKTIEAFRDENSPQKLNTVINELVK